MYTGQTPVKRRNFSHSKYLIAFFFCFSAFVDPSDSLADPLLITQELASIEEELFELTPESSSSEEGTHSFSTLPSTLPLPTLGSQANQETFETLLAYQSVLMQLKIMAEKGSNGLVVSLPSGGQVDLVAPVLEDLDPQKPLIESEDRDQLKRILGLRKKYRLKFIPMDLYAMVRFSRLFLANPVDAQKFVQHSTNAFVRAVDQNLALPEYGATKLTNVLLNSPPRFQIHFPSFLRTGENFSFEANYDSKNNLYVTFPKRKLGRGAGKLAYEIFRFSDFARLARLTINDEPPAGTSMETQKQNFALEARFMSQIRARSSEAAREQFAVPIDVAPGQIIMKKYTTDLFSFLLGDDKLRVRPAKLSPIDRGKLLLRLTKAVADLHDLDFVHKDLKPENIFMDYRRDATGKAEFWPICADFGLSEKLCKHQPFENFKRRCSGSPDYFAPELCETHWFGRSVNSKKVLAKRADVFSLGVIAHVILEGINTPRFNTALDMPDLNEAERIQKRNEMVEGQLDDLETRPTLQLRDLLYFGTWTNLSYRFDARRLEAFLELMLKNPISLRESNGRAAPREAALFKRKDLLNLPAGYGIRHFKSTREAVVQGGLADSARVGSYVLWIRNPDTQGAPPSSPALAMDLAHLAITYAEPGQPGSDSVRYKTKLLADLDPDHLVDSLEVNLAALRLGKIID